MVLFCLGKKALVALTHLDESQVEMVETVVVGKDPKVQEDFSAQIIDFCQQRNMKWIVRNEATQCLSGTLIAIGWRWLIPVSAGQTLIIFHDSLLPKNRGFNPLVTALINGDSEVGVTAIVGGSQYDTGDIIAVEKVPISHPIRISDAIDLVALCYGKLLRHVFHMLIGDEIHAVPQDEGKATYSLWRDEEDYYIDWTWSSDKIQRFIYAVGYPYQGARTRIEGDEYIVADAELVRDVVIENRTPGKVIFRVDDRPVVVCGTGLLKLNALRNVAERKVSFPSKFRLRFK